MFSHLPFLEINGCTNMLEAALVYARHGVPVFPCRPTDKGPYTKHGFKDASTDETAIKTWWRRRPNALIGMPTGWASGVWVLDVDFPAGPASLANLEAQIGPLPRTLEQVSGSGGRHMFFAMVEGVEIKCSTSKIGRNLDVRGVGGYVIVAPSLPSPGNRYQWHLPDGCPHTIAQQEVPR